MSINFLKIVSKLKINNIEISRLIAILIKILKKIQADLKVKNVLISVQKIVLNLFYFILKISIIIVS
jgi:hypothetical protein